MQFAVECVLTRASVEEFVGSPVPDQMWGFIAQRVAVRGTWAWDVVGRPGDNNVLKRAVGNSLPIIAGMHGPGKGHGKGK
jgi:hypothetical protein